LLPLGCRSQQPPQTAVIIPTRRTERPAADGGEQANHQRRRSEEFR
jgi:hypothetical protein